MRVCFFIVLCRYPWERQTRGREEKVDPRKEIKGKKKSPSQVRKELNTAVRPVIELLSQF